MTPTPVLIAGATASGKSALALELAQTLRGRVINADSMQVYREWRILTARPGPAEAARVPHRLYGHVCAREDWSVGRWLRAVKAELADCAAAGATPILVGGTGLYFTALTEGLAEIPEIPEPVRRAAQARLERDGLAAFRAALLARDPEAATLDPKNPRRLLRAWEVLEATGRPLSEWRARTPPPLTPPAAARAFVLEADRETLRTRIAARFRAMLAEGALDEARAVRALDLPPEAPALKAIGAAPLFAHLRGEIGLEQAASQAIHETRRYAKRQRTWFRNRLGGWRRAPAGPDAAQAVLAAL